ncbi:MAG: signal peptidase I [Solobacterium sp.]|nr:signal peptidase I [Solobacterium sp.]
MSEKNITGESIWSDIWDFIKTLLISMTVVFVLADFVIRPIRVDGSSMFPTLKDGSLGLANVIGYRVSGLKRFDIAIIYLSDKKEYLVKRVIGMPGDTVEYRDGRLFINGELTEEPFFDSAYKESYSGVFMQDVSAFELGEGQYYCLGDNRPNSRDSRYYGPFYKDQIFAKGALIIWPFDQAGVKSW